MSSELELITAQMSNIKKDGNFYTGNLSSREVAVVQSGIGKVSSALACAEMISRYAPSCIINTGVAGGLDSSLDVMDIVVARELLYNDVWCGEGNEFGQVQGLPARFMGDTKLIDIAMGCSVEGVKILSGVVCSGDRFITSRSELDQIKKQIPEVLSTDMESTSIAQVCYIYHTPSLSVRVISDTPGQSNHTAQYDNFWTEVPKKSFEIIKQIIDKIQ